MKISEFIEEVTAGGPGFDGYLYQGALFCAGCGEDLAQEIAPKVAPMIDGTDDPLFCDSDTVPQPCFYLQEDENDTCARCSEPVLEFDQTWGNY